MHALNPKKSSRRISSLFSLGSDKDKDKDSSNASIASGPERLTASPDYIAPAETSHASKKLSKDRVSSHQLLAPEYPPPPPPKSLASDQPTISPIEAGVGNLDLQPPPPLAVPSPPFASPSASRPSSRSNSRPGTPVLGSASNLSVQDGGRKLKRKSWIFGGGRSSDDNIINNAGNNGPLAWVVGHQGKPQYNMSLLLGGEKVPELWDDEGDTFVYLFPRTSGKGPSFRIDSSVYAASPSLTQLAFGSIYSESTPTVNHRIPDRSSRVTSSGYSASSRTASPEPSDLTSLPEGSSDGSKGSRNLSDTTDDVHSEIHLVLPIALSTDSAVTPGEPRLTSKDVEKLVAYRNFFAFLLGQSLVATEKNSSLFDIFLRIADLLEQYQFSNVDGSTFGEVAATSFDSYVEELHLADVRHSREKTIEAIVLGEKLRSVMLYTEAFSHAVGKYDDIRALQSPKFRLINHKTGNRLERASMDLELRIQTINTKLNDFDFPAVFSGIMNSKTADEGKIIKFEAWRSSFMATRKTIISYYKSKYGSWPPKASSKKNNLETSGLNRLVLLDIYNDLSDLYDLLVDRKNITNRTYEGALTDDAGGNDHASVTARALRSVLSEYDRSTPPVQPPAPFDIPLYPDLSLVSKHYPTNDPKKDAKARGKKLKDDEIGVLLKHSKNADADKPSPFLSAFREHERKAAHGKNLDDIWDLRSGQWLFLYAVIQSLPMLVVDAPGVRFGQGVEYFLCEPPRSGMPWMREDTTTQRSYYIVQGTQGVVSMPTHAVEFGVEGVYRRSHCWKMAAKWTANNPLLNAAVQETVNDPLPPPPGLLQPPQQRSRSQSPDRRRQSVMDLGLEALPLPAGVAPASPALRPKSSNDPTKTFDAILGTTANAPTKDKKKKR